MTLAPGRSRDPSATRSTTSRVPLAASMTGAALTTTAHPAHRRRLRRWRDHRRGRSPPLASGTRTRAMSGDVSVTRNSVSPTFTKRPARAYRAVTTPPNGATTLRELDVAPRLPSREIGLAILELDLLGIGDGDAAGLRHQSRAHSDLAEIVERRLRLRERDLLIGVLQQRQAARRHSRDRSGRPSPNRRCRPLAPRLRHRAPRRAAPAAEAARLHRRRFDQNSGWRLRRRSRGRRLWLPAAGAKYREDRR